MSGAEPKRLKDDPNQDQLLRDMIGSSREHVPSEGQLQSLMSRLDGIESAAVAAPVVSSTSKILFLMAVVTLVLGGSWYLMAERGEGREVEAMETSAIMAPAPAIPEEEIAKVVHTHAESGTAEEPRPVATEAEVEEGDSTDTRKPEAKAPAMNSPTSKTKQPGVDAAKRAASELQIIQDAREALKAGSWNKALALSEGHRDSFTHGLLGEEREAIAIEALLGLGRVSDAKGRLQRMEILYPKSSYLARLRSQLGDGE